MTTNEDSFSELIDKVKNEKYYLKLKPENKPVFLKENVNLDNYKNIIFDFGKCEKIVLEKIWIILFIKNLNNMH